MEGVVKRIKRNNNSATSTQWSAPRCLKGGRHARERGLFLLSKRSGYACIPTRLHWGGTERVSQSKRKTRGGDGFNGDDEANCGMSNSNQRQLEAASSGGWKSQRRRRGPTSMKKGGGSHTALGSPTSLLRADGGKWLRKKEWLE